MDSHDMRSCFWVGLLLLCLLSSPWGESVALAADLGAPSLSPPLQLEGFFDTRRLSTRSEEGGAPGSLEPELGLSHAAREEAGSGVSQKSHRIHGEAGGRLTLLDNVSLTAIARLPLYTYEARTTELSPGGEGKVSTDMMRSSGNLSWRSELGVSLGKGIDLNLFYDRAMFGRVDRPGTSEADEKFGTRFIIRFK